jgi:hypothetical protein
VAPERPEPGPSDWLLADIGERLRAEGYAIRLRYGAGADTIPMVVGGPRDRGYRVAVVTDETPAGAAISVRDRLRWQVTRLEKLGWIVVPLWTLDVFTDPDSALGAIRTALDSLSLHLVFHRIGSMFCLFFTNEPVVDLASAQRSDRQMFGRFFSHCLDHGVYLAPSPFETGFISTAHSAEDIERTATVMAEALRVASRP